MRNFFHSLMTDKNKKTFFAPLKFVMYLASLIYGLALIIRRTFYKLSIFRVNKVPVKVISVGNLTLGGTGKTPFVIYLAKLLKDDIKRNVSVLTRGYGWDEQSLLKKNLGDIPVLVGEDRARSVRKTIKLYGSDTAVLDDGFQHWELARNMDIVLIDSRNPFGNGKLLPRGVLREPKSALKRADIVVLTKVDGSMTDLTALKAELKKINNDLMFLTAYHKPKNIYDIKTKKPQDVSMVKGRSAILLSGIGDPKYFKETVKKLGVEVVAHLKFQDHHNYTSRDIARVVSILSEKKFDLIITTEKDAVKFSRLGLSIGNYPVMVLAIEITLMEGRDSLIARLNSLYSR